MIKRSLPTDRNMRVSCNRELFDDPLRRHAGLAKVSQHLDRLRFSRAICCPNLYCVVFRMIPSDCSNIRDDLTVFDLQWTRHSN